MCMLLQKMSFGNVSSVYECEIPQLVLKSSVNLKLANGKGGIVLDWSDYDISNKYFVIYRKEKNSNNWENIVSLDKRFNGNSYTDNLANDTTTPVVLDIDINENVENNNIDLLPKLNDEGSMYNYYIEAYDTSDVSVLLATSNKILQ